MIKENLAAIDLGSNSCRLKITDGKGKMLFRKAVTTKLGEGLQGNGKFSDEAWERGLRCLSEYAQIMREYEVGHYRAITTASCRMAANGEEFVKAVREITGISLEIIDAGEEAMLNLRGARLNASADAEYIAVYDLGGGSTEVTLAENSDNPNILYTLSIPWGARTAAEAFDLLEYDEIKAQKLAAEISKYMNDFMQQSQFAEYRDSCECLATSSTPLRLLSMVKNFGSYDRDLADGAEANVSEIDKVIEKVRKMNLTELSESAYIGVNRAPIIQAACVIFQTIYRILGVNKIKASLKSAQDAIIEDLVRKWQN